MYFSTRTVGKDHALYMDPPENSVEHVYSAIEFINDDESTAYPIVCYRTKDGMTHLAVFKDGEFTIRKSVRPFGK